MKRVRCRHCGEEVHPEHPMCCGNWEDVEVIPDDELGLYERDFPVDLDGKRYGGTYDYYSEEE